LLALDTATECCSVALLRAGVATEQAEDVGQRHSERLLPMVQALLAQAGVGVQDLDAVAFGAGPGSFTGLRIACGAAQGLAFGLALPVLPVGNLRVLAADVLLRLASARRVGVAIDARMNEVYWAVYERGETAEALHEVAPPSLSGAAEGAAEFARLGVDAVGGNALSIAGVQWPATAARAAEARASAAGIARLAALDWSAGRAIAAAQAAPLYVRDRVALTIEERRATASAA
jgi:tRNA threonylcarbamoyladenosine biosynthesis protein TsaB